MKGRVLEIPVSVATFMRVPMFWLALHLFPKRVYYGLARKCVKRDGYFATYFHPWEFADLAGFAVVPGYIKKNSGVKLVKRLHGLVDSLKAVGYDFATYSEYAEMVRTRK